MIQANNHLPSDHSSRDLAEKYISKLGFASLPKFGKKNPKWPQRMAGNELFGTQIDDANITTVFQALLKMLVKQRYCCGTDFLTRERVIQWRVL